MKHSLLVMVLFLCITTLAPAKEVMSEPIEEKQAAEEMQVIPDEAIRLRILANSDRDEDQEIKRYVRDEVNAYISELVQEVDEIEKAREMIREQVPTIETIIAETLEELNADSDFTVEYSNKVSFPMKVYDQYVYPAGEYEAILITLGAGEGANWWCVLFPPLCFLDFSNGTTVEGEADIQETEELELAEESAVEEEEAEEEMEATSEEEEETKISFLLWEWLGLS